MVFSSPVFLFFFLPWVLLLFFLSPHAVRTTLLFVASLAFYAWGETFYVFFLLASVLANWLLGLAIAATAADRGRRALVTLAVVGNLGALAYFKYAGFLSTNLGWVTTHLGLPAVPVWTTHLPIGVSFVTFEAISYVVDVYRGTIVAQRNPIHVGFFMSFFPHLIAGPVLRYSNVAGPLKYRPTVTLPLFELGVRTFIIGLAKKVLVANTVSRVADAAFALHPPALSAGAAWFGVVCYAIQIYYDFSGYTDMAIGLGRMCGFELPQNFNRPYAATSIRDFWRRWHITLSSWFRDYLYLPLGGNRVSAGREYGNLFTVFLLCGLWHGASWTFVAWGAFHGFFLVIERLAPGRALRSLWRPLQHVYAMVVVLFSWTLFRSESIGQAWSFMRAMLGAGVAGPGARDLWLNDLDPEIALTLLVAIPLATLPFADWLRALQARGAERPWERNALAFGRAASLLVLFLASAAYLASGTHNPFIYFRF
jgi:alginate O-acetyltransferase complex protein AlgI